MTRDLYHTKDFIEHNSVLYKAIEATLTHSDPSDLIKKKKKKLIIFTQ